MNCDRKRTVGNKSFLSAYELERWLCYMYLTIYIFLLSLRPKPANNVIQPIMLLDLAQTCICEVKIRCKARYEKNP